MRISDWSSDVCSSDLLTLLVGMYAQRHYLGRRRQPTLTETVRHWRDYGPDFLPLPHPSWRNTVWLKKHPWFEADLLPELRRLVQRSDERREGKEWGSTW